MGAALLEQPVITAPGTGKVTAATSDHVESRLFEKLRM